MKRKTILKAKQEQTELKSIEKGFVFAMYVCLNALLMDFWPKADKKKLDKFMNRCLDLFGAVINGNVDYQECIDYIYDTTGYKIEID